ncbi:MAG: choice-of-anchor D domain-containing protein [Bacteroidota bacterium]
MKKILLLLIFFTAAQVYAQPRISYLLPDIGTPDMNTYVEIIGPGDLASKGNFGANGIYYAPGNTQVQLRCVNPADNDKIVFGPLVVSWDGRMISTQIFVNPWVQPNSSDWQALNPAFKIPIQLVVNSLPSNIDTFYIVKPFAFGNQTANNESILGFSTLGKRSRRGAMIVDSMILATGRIYTVSNADSDPANGNQGFLPFVLLSKGRISTSGAFAPIISVNGGIASSGRAGSGGPGGGGGGGRFFDGIFTNNIGDDGGSGFTGGGGGGRNKSGGNTYKEGGLGSGSSATGVTGGMSLNGIGGATTPGFEASGGGTGHPFGTSGVGCDNGAGCNPPGGYGGGSGYQQNQKGGAGGYATEGNPVGSRGGKVHGNIPVVPIAGGSGGASGNPQGIDVYSGSGGGGGGAMQIFGSQIVNVNCSANGGDGITTGNNRDGGSGSGGYIGAQAKLLLQNIAISAVGGVGAQQGGAGRLRTDAPVQMGVGITPATNVLFRGPTTDTSSQVNRSFTLRGSGSTAPGVLIDVYVRSFNNPSWTVNVGVIPSGGTWSLPLTLPGTDSVYYAVAIQREGSDPAPNTADYTYRPSNVMSQAAANILKLITAAVIAGDSVRRLPSSLCASDVRFDTVYVKSLGEANLILQTPAFKNGNQGFTLIEPTAAQFPFSVDRKGGVKDSVRLIVRFKAPASQGIFSDTLLIQNNDSSALKRPYKIYYEAKKDTAGFTLLNQSSQEIDTLDFGKICIGSAQTLTYLFKNASSVPVIFDPLNVTLVDKSNFSIAPPAKTTLTVNQAGVPIAVTFAGQTLGKIQTKIYMNIAECGFKDSLIVKAEGISTNISFKDPSAQFGDVLLNSSSTIKVVVINDGPNDALIQQTSDVISPPFSIVNFTPGPLPVLLTQGQELTIDVAFTPTVTGDYNAVLKMASLFKIGASCIDTAQALLSGRGVDQNIQTTVNSLDYGIVARCDTKLDTVQVINKGSAPVQITGAGNLSGADNTAFKIKSQPGGLPLTLAPNALSPYYIIEFIPQAGSDGAKSAQLQIPTSDPKNAILSVELSAEQRSLVVSNPSPVILDPIPVPQTGFKSFTITNTGVLDAGVISIRSRQGITTVAPTPPQTIPANNGSVNFTATMAALKAGQLYDTLEIIYNQPCIDTQYVFLNTKGIQGTVAYTDNLPYGTLSVCRDSIQRVSFTNTGEADVVFKSATVIGVDAGLFKILIPIAPNTIIQPDSVLTFDVEFNPQNSIDGFKTAEVQTIITIAGTDQTFTTQLGGTRQTAILETPMSPVNFGVVELNTTSEKILSLKNTSTFDMLIDQAQLDAIAGNGIFEVVIDQAGVTLPHVLKPDESLRFRVKFTPDEEQEYTDTLRLNITSPCSDKKVIAIVGNGGASLFSTIFMPDTTAATPGIQNFTIPLYIDLDKMPASVITTGFKAEIAYDKTLFSVRKLSKGSITNRITDAVTGEEVVTIEVDNVALNSAVAFVATELQGNVYLGGSNYTPIRFKSFVWTGTVPRVDSTKDGSLTIDGICYEGGRRLVRLPDTTLVSLNVQPNPVNREAEFTVSVIENGAHTLEVYNTQGIKLWEQPFVHSGVSGKSYSFKTGLNELAEGVYTVILKTPTKTRTRQFLIIK